MLQYPYKSISAAYVSLSLHEVFDMLVVVAYN